MPVAPVDPAQRVSESSMSHHARQLGARSSALVGALVGVVIAAEPSAGQTCQPFWVRPAPFSPARLGADVAFDDGAGERLYGGGSLDGCAGANFAVARWDGYSWQTIMQGLPALEGAFGEQVLDDGTGPALYVRGWYLETSGSRLDRMWRWSGSRWMIGAFV
jgi:hypothetical protein